MSYIKNITRFEKIIISPLMTVRSLDNLLTISNFYFLTNATKYFFLPSDTNTPVWDTNELSRTKFKDLKKKRKEKVLTAKIWTKFDKKERMKKNVRKNPSPFIFVGSNHYPMLKGTLPFVINPQEFSRFYHEE